VGPHGDPSLIFLHHGQPEKETSSENEQAQAPEALEVESTPRGTFPSLKPAAFRGGLFVG
jgi:hypothetical protein